MGDIAGCLFCRSAKSFFATAIKGFTRILLWTALLLAGADAGGGVQAQSASQSKAVFAGGCFWCVVAIFDQVPGVEKVLSGYTGGHLANPTYEEVSKGGTGHVEAVEVTYNPSKVDYEKLLDLFWHNIDPTQSGGQFCDKGNQYRSVIFYQNDSEKDLAEKSRTQVAQKLQKTIYTEILPAKPFYPAEEYHQDYYKKNPIRYRLYRSSCGRDNQLKQVWGESPKHPE